MNIQDQINKIETNYKKIISLFEVPIKTKYLKKEKDSKLQLVLKKLNLDSNLNTNKLIELILEKLNIIKKNINYNNNYKKKKNKNNNNKNIIDNNINTFYYQVLYFNKIYKLYYFISKNNNKKKNFFFNFNLKKEIKNNRIITSNYNINLRKIKNINDTKVLSFTHKLILKGKILDLKLKYLIINKKIELLKLKIKNLWIKKKNNKNIEFNLNLDKDNNNNTLPLFQPFGDKDKRKKGDLIFVYNNYIISPLKTLYLLNTLYSMGAAATPTATYQKKNNYYNINFNKEDSNLKFNSVLLSLLNYKSINKNSNNNSDNLWKKKYNKSYVILPKEELPNYNLSLYEKSHNNNYSNKNNTLNNINKYSFVDFQLPNTKVLDSVSSFTHTYFLKKNYIKLQETIKDLMINFTKEFNIEKEVVAGKASKSNHPNNMINNLSNNKNISLSTYNSNVNIIDYIKSITKQKDIKINQIVGYKFNIEINKIIKNINKILDSFFIAINCLISKPKFIISNDKIIIKLFFFKIKQNNKEFKKIFQDLNYYLYKMKKLNYVLFNKLNNIYKLMDINLINQNEVKNNSLLYLKKTIKEKYLNNIILFNNWYNSNKFLKSKSNNYKFLYKKNHIYYSFVRMHFKLVKFNNDKILIIKKNFLNKNYVKFKIICEIISRFFKKPLDLYLIRVFYPYNDSNIFVKFLALNIKKMRMKMIIKKLLQKAVFKKSNNYNDDFGNSLSYLLKSAGNSSQNINVNYINNIPAVLSGFKIKIAGRLMSKILIPRKTVTNTVKGTISKNKIQFVDKARFTSKNKRGAYSITVYFGQNLQS